MEYNAEDKPVIGLCLGHRRDQSLKQLNRLATPRLERYPSGEQIAIIAFALEDWNSEEKWVKGWHCVHFGPDIHWEEKTVPLPDAVFIQCKADGQMVSVLEQGIGRKVYNNCFLDK